MSASTGNTNRSITATSVAATLALNIANSLSLTVTVALAAAVTTAELGSTVSAEVTNGATITSAGSVQVLASSLGSITVKVGAGALSGTIDGSPSISLAIAAAVAVDSVDDDVTASVLVSTVTGSSVTIGATSSTPVDGLAVALALSLTISDDAAISLTGAGAEVRNEVGGTTAAQVSGSFITATSGPLAVTATSGGTTANGGHDQLATVAAVSGSLTVSEGVDIGVSVAVALGSNTSSTTTSASVDSGSNLCAGVRTGGSCGTPAGAVTVSANSTAVLSVQLGAGTLTIGVGDGGNLSIGVALASNTISGTTSATVDTSVVVGGSVAVTAEGDGSVDALAVAVSLAVQASESGLAVTLQGNGAKATNVVGGTVSATVSGASLVQAATDITVSTKGLSSFKAQAAAGSLGVAVGSDGIAASVSVDVGLASNTLSTQVFTEVSGSTLDAQGRVQVTATSDRLVAGQDRMIALAVAVAVTIAIVNPTEGFGVALSGTGTSVDNTASDSVHAWVYNGSTVTARGDRDRGQCGSEHRRVIGRRRLGAGVLGGRRSQRRPPSRSAFRSSPPR